MRTDKRSWIGAAVTWLLPLLVSFGLYDPASDAYFPNFAAFKIIMLVLLAIMTFLTYRWIAKAGPLTIAVPILYLTVNSLLDLGLLIVAFGMPLGTWLFTVLPGYAFVFFAIYWLLARRAG